MEIEEILELLQNDYNKARRGVIASIEVEFLSDKRIVEAIIKAGEAQSSPARCFK